MQSTTMRRLWGAFVAAFVAATMLLAAAPAQAIPDTVGVLPGYAPADWTPHMAADADANTTEEFAALATSDKWVFMGGFATKAQNPGRTTTMTCGHLVWQNLATKATACPVRFNGPVESLFVSNGFLFVGGNFTSVTDGAGSVTLRSLAKINIATKQVDRTFNAKVNWGVVSDITAAKGHLIIAGSFSVVGGASRVGLASIAQTNGAVNTYVNLGITGKVMSTASTDVYRLAVRPQGDMMFIIGNFTTVGNQPRKRAAMVLLNDTEATVGQWSSAYMDGNCKSYMAAYLRDVNFSSDGTRFAIGTTGGMVLYPALCDSVSEWTTTDAPNQAPNWIDYTPADTIHSIHYQGEGGSPTAVVYAGGHQKAHNTKLYNGTTQVSTPSVPSAGIGALRASDGKAYNTPFGRDRNIGARFIMHLPADAYHGAGILVGSDAYWWNNANWATFPLDDQRRRLQPATAGYRGGVAFLPFK